MGLWALAPAVLVPLVVRVPPALQGRRGQQGQGWSVQWVLWPMVVWAPELLTWVLGGQLALLAPLVLLVLQVQWVLYGLVAVAQQARWPQGRVAEVRVVPV